MCGSFPTHLISLLSPGVPMLHVKPETRLKCQTQRGKMLLGTFKTVFNSQFLEPTKTNTLQHMAKIERCSLPESGGKMRAERQRGRRDIFTLHQQIVTIWCPFCVTRCGFRAQEGQCWLVCHLSVPPFVSRTRYHTNYQSECYKILVFHSTFILTETQFPLCQYCSPLECMSPVN